MKERIEFHLGSLKHFKKEGESKEYEACLFIIDKAKYMGRKAKVTPKKKGQFVTFWKRPEKEITPYKHDDNFDFLFVLINDNSYFLFPKHILMKNEIISTIHKEGKRAFRLYHPKEDNLNKKAKKSQEWQRPYFYTTN